MQQWAKSTVLVMSLQYTCDAPLQYFASGHSVNSRAPPVIPVHFVFTLPFTHDVYQTVASKLKMYRRITFGS